MSEDQKRLIAWMESNRLYIRPADGWHWPQVLIEDPGGHYQEDRMKVIGSAQTLTEAVEQANAYFKRLGDDWTIEGQSAVRGIAEKGKEA